MFYSFSWRYYNTFPTLHASDELRYRAIIKVKILCMLMRSSLPVAFWWFAVERDVYLFNRYKCVHGVAPGLDMRCKCYALKPFAEGFQQQSLLRFSG